MKRELPVVLAIICVLGFIGVPLSIIFYTYNILFEAAVIPVWYSVFNLVLLIPYFLGLIFIWQMKKKGVVFYTGAALIDYVVAFFMGFFSFEEVFISLIAIGIFWFYYNKMR